MKPRMPFATTAQRQAWQDECRRIATRRMLPADETAIALSPGCQSRLAAEYRRARRQHMEALRLAKLQRDEADSERVKLAMDELQMELI